MPKMLIIDDEQDIIETIRIYFECRGFQVYGAACPASAYDQLAVYPDIILLDIMMPDMDGISFCRNIREKVLCPILFLTAKTNESSKIQGLSAGGDDYITKPFSMSELSARIEAHMRRENRPKNHNMRVNFTTSKKEADGGAAGLWIDYGRKEIGCHEVPIDFTKKEYYILELLSLNPAQVFSQDRIYEAVWGYLAEGDARSAVMEHVKRIRKKLSACGCRDYIETVWGIGYRWKN